MTNIAINEKKHTIELTKKDYDKACKFGTQEYLDLQEVRKAYPNYKVVKVTRKASKNTYKGLTYEYMENYIKSHNEELLVEFYELCGKDENGKKINFGVKLSYGEVRMWFLEQFPEIENFEARKKLDDKMEAIRKARAARKAA